MTGGLWPAFDEEEKEQIIEDMNKVQEENPFKNEIALIEKDPDIPVKAIAA